MPLINRVDYRAVPYFIVAALAFNLSGCGNSDMAELHRSIDRIKARPQTAIEPLPKLKTPQPLAVNSKQLRDPFAPVARLNRANSQQTQPTTRRNQGALEAYSLDQLSMVGTITMNGMWALIRTGDGTVYRVSEGGYLGRNGGKISRISEHQVELVEKVLDATGTWRNQPTSIALVGSRQWVGSKP